MAHHQWDQRRDHVLRHPSHRRSAACRGVRSI